MPDKSKEVFTDLKLVSDRLNFMGYTDYDQPISVDYIPPLGDNKGYTSLELFLLSLSSCLGTSVLTLLRRMKKTVTSFEVKTVGYRREEHPTGFRNIRINIYLKSPDVSADEIDKAVKLSEDTYCPVWSMIKGNTEVEVVYEIENPHL